ncbi:MAG: hypothetical protein J2P22_04595 [Nocardioides sp.]|nr:hypothetical protein [Nocardioides sp.]
MSTVQPTTRPTTSTIAVVGAAVVALIVVTLMIWVATRDSGGSSFVPTIQMPNPNAHDQRPMRSGLQVGQP